MRIVTLSDARGIPLSLVTATGNNVDITLAEPTVSSIHLAHSRIGGATILSDKGYDSLPFRIFLSDHEFFPHIPKRSTTNIPPKKSWYYVYDKATGKRRYVIERTNA